MAINFSASFAACLAAGLKVPRQIMYCISQGKCRYDDGDDGDAAYLTSVTAVRVAVGIPECPLSTV